MRQKDEEKKNLISFIDTEKCKKRKNREWFMACCINMKMMFFIVFLDIVIACVGVVNFIC